MVGLQPARPCVEEGGPCGAVPRREGPTRNLRGGARGAGRQGGAEGSRKRRASSNEAWLKLRQCERVEQAGRWSGVAGLELEEPDGEGGCSVWGWGGVRQVGRRRGPGIAGLRVTQKAKPPTLAWYF